MAATQLSFSLDTVSPRAFAKPKRYTLEAGKTRIRINCGAMSPEIEGTYMTSKTTDWGPQHLIETEDGPHWTDEIRKPGVTTVNGSPIGCYFAG